MVDTEKIDRHSPDQGDMPEVDERVHRIADGAIGNTVDSASDRRWYATPRFRLVAGILLGVVFLGSFLNGVLKKDNDFRIHYYLGVRCLEGLAYVGENGEREVFDNYPVGRLVVNGALALFPYRVARGVCWAFAVVCLFLSLRLWHGMAQLQGAGSKALSIAAGALVLVVLSPWVVRDLDDCGLQIILLFILTAGAWTLLRNKPAASGLLLALASTYKVTPVLFLPLLLFKRRWREAAWMAVFVLALNVLLPMPLLGVSGTLRANGVFFSKVASVAGAGAEDPTANGVESPKHSNRSLKLAILRYLQTYQAGHPLFIAHPGDVDADRDGAGNVRAHPLFVQFFDLPPRLAGHIASAVMLTAAVALLYLFRHKWGQGPHEADLAGEWAVMTGLCAILSPLCWGQHLVLVIPAMFLTIRAALDGQLGRWRTVLLALIVLAVLAPQRAIFGRELCTVIHSYKPQPLAVLLCMALVLTLPKVGKGQQKRTALEAI
ncbi:MAG: DUF2029 domain-containing protein [Planctomycetes bacterium]|nr:DUF2029 domain-containing protein [Planctomycetota bacterium]